MSICRLCMLCSISMNTTEVHWKASHALFYQHECHRSTLGGSVCFVLSAWMPQKYIGRLCVLCSISVNATEVHWKASYALFYQHECERSTLEGFACFVLSACVTQKYIGRLCMLCSISMCDTEVLLLLWNTKKKNFPWHSHVCSLFTNEEDEGEEEEEEEESSVKPINSCVLFQNMDTKSCFHLSQYDPSIWKMDLN